MLSKKKKKLFRHITHTITNQNWNNSIVEYFFFYVIRLSDDISSARGTFYIFQSWMKKQQQHEHQPKKYTKFFSLFFGIQQHFSTFFLFWYDSIKIVRDEIHVTYLHLSSISFWHHVQNGAQRERLFIC